MKFTSRDTRIMGILNDIAGEEWIHNCTINVQCSASYLLSHAAAIFAAIQQVIPPFENTVITIEKGVVYSQICEFVGPSSADIWDGVSI